jgi:hypothetical protein
VPNIGQDILSAPTMGPHIVRRYSRHRFFAQRG